MPYSQHLSYNHEVTKLLFDMFQLHTPLPYKIATKIDLKYNKLS